MHSNSEPRFSGLFIFGGLLNDWFNSITCAENGEKHASINELFGLENETTFLATGHYKHKQIFLVNVVTVL